MTDPPSPRIEISSGDDSQLQLIFGEHNTVQTAKGMRVSALQPGEHPTPVLRERPVGDHASPRAPLVGREAELKVLAGAGPGAPFELTAPDGTGKSAILKAVALRELGRTGGTVFISARRRSLPDLQTRLFHAFYDCDARFIPGPAQVRGLLSGHEALVVIDDCEIDRVDLDALLDNLATCTVVMASGARTLWGRGTAEELAGLAPAAGVQLIEDQLGRPIAAADREAAVALVARLGGHPQLLVETAALISTGGATIAALAQDPAVLARAGDQSMLNETQRRILSALGTIKGADLGVEHIATLTDSPDAAEQLEQLERFGWVRSNGPRYRIGRAYAGPADPAVRDRVEQRVLAYLAGWSRQATPAEVAAEADAIELAVTLGSARPYREASLSLALASQAKLAVGGAWSTWRLVLLSALDVARSLGNASAEAHLLHQLGSRSLCLGDTGLARAKLEQALEIRERLSDAEGAEVTRHNLRQMGGGGPSIPVLGGAPGADRRWMRWALVGAGVVIAAVLAAVLLSGGKSKHAKPTAASTPPTTTASAAPTAVITSPASGTTYASTAIPKARYSCAAVAPATIKSCVGSVPVGQTVAKSPGNHHFIVTATDSAGLTTTKTILYSVTTGNGAPPQITISSPKNDASYAQNASGANAEYLCAAGTDDSPVTSCKGTVPAGTALPTSKPGTNSFTVTAKSKSGGASTKTVTYTVTAATTPSTPATSPTTP